jgi:cobalamin-dependent methionine synthase I
LATQFALFAVTLGSGVSERISLLFDEQEFALGALLDGAASESAEIACRVTETEYRRALTLQGRLNNDHGVLPFSPGYCGWHISAQRLLFDLLRPGEIGIALGETFLMEPLKSISGVLVAAPKAAFLFDDDFPFCATCATRTCRDRIQAVVT